MALVTAALAIIIGEIGRPVGMANYPAAGGINTAHGYNYICIHAYIFGLGTEKVY